MAGSREELEDPKGLQLARGGLRFVSAETEGEYRGWHVQRAIPAMRAGMAAGVVAWVASLLMGTALFPAVSSGPTAGWILGLMVPVLLGSWAITHRPRLLGWVLPSMALNIALAGTLGVAIAFKFDLPEMGMVCVITISLFASTVIRLQLLPTSLSLVPFVVLNQLLLIVRFRAGRIDTATLALYSLAATNSVITGLFACAAFDRTSRESFRRECIIERQRQTIEREAARADVAERARQLSEALLRLSGAVGRLARLAPGDVVEERYRVVRALGRGGMGEVHEVERIADAKHFALKVLTGHIDRTALARFAREAQVAAEIDHLNVIRVHDVGVSPSGMLFLVMELVSGGSTLAAETLRYGNAAWALPILGQVAAALATMHARGIVHRDLKPANVLLDGAVAKVADFGLASLSVPRHDADPSAATAPLRMGPSDITRTGAVFGTPLYLAPELASGIRGAAPSADIWSFGVMAHELLARTLPFTEPPLLAHLAGRSVVAAAPLNAPSLSVALRALIDACLSSDPALRPSALLLRDVLAAETSQHRG